MSNDKKTVTIQEKHLAVLLALATSFIEATVGSPRQAINN